MYKNELLAPLFNCIDKDETSQNMYEFLIERFGGPKYYTERKGTPALFHRHHNIILSKEQCDEWLNLMGLSLREQTSTFDEDSCQILMDYFKYTAHSILVYHMEAVKLVPEILKIA